MALAPKGSPSWAPISLPTRTHTPLLFSPPPFSSSSPILFALHHANCTTQACTALHVRAHPLRSCTQAVTRRAPIRPHEPPCMRQRQSSSGAWSCVRRVMLMPAGSASSAGRQRRQVGRQAGFSQGRRKQERHRQQGGHLTCAQLRPSKIPRNQDGHTLHALTLNRLHTWWRTGPGQTGHRPLLLRSCSHLGGPHPAASATLLARLPAHPAGHSQVHSQVHGRAGAPTDRMGRPAVPALLGHPARQQGRNKGVGVAWRGVVALKGASRACGAHAPHLSSRALAGALASARQGGRTHRQDGLAYSACAARPPSKAAGQERTLEKKEK